MKGIIFLLAIAVGLTIGPGCKKDKAPSTSAELRIFNATPFIFYNCTIDPRGTFSDNPGPNACNFGQIEIDSKTDYKTFTDLYRYAWVRLTINNKTYYLKPYDYTRETFLESGRYTYKLTHTPNNDQLNFEFVKD